VDAAADALLAANADRVDAQATYNVYRADLIEKRAAYNAAVLALVAASLASLNNPGSQED
jgi:hypothetical protein